MTNDKLVTEIYIAIGIHHSLRPHLRRYFRTTIIRIFHLFILSLILTCCTNKPSDQRLSRVEDLSHESPQEAWDSLGGINYDLLSNADKHYYDFLLVKVSDKAYITHTSDSLILKVIDFESKHRENGRYPEALYYGGRVYSDLGDYPTSLYFFQKANDEVSPESTDLKCRILSQTGRLLNSLRLYEQAIPYITSSLEIEKSLKDSVSMTHDLILLGGTYLRASNYEQALRYFNQAIKINTQNPQLKAKSIMYLAATKYKIGQIDSALLLIRDIPTKVNPLVRRSALGYASNIYLKAGILDTAYMYAKELISDKEEHVAIGYQVLLSPELRQYILPDSLNQYIDDYRSVLETYYDENMSQLAINQQALYNYQMHEKERIKAEKSNQILRACIIGFVFIILLLGVIVLSLKNSNKNNIIKLHNALENISQLERSIELTYKTATKTDDFSTDIAISNKESDSETIHNLRNRLRLKLYKIYNEHIENNKSISISPLIIESEAYEHLQELVSKKAELKENDCLWQELEDTVIKCSPNFKKNLQLLVGGKLTSYDLHTAILIKCGISLSQMTNLLNRSKGAIVSRRESLCFRVFDEKLGTKVIDGIVRLL
jgi:Tfp pilus assembly protein PilF